MRNTYNTRYSIAQEYCGATLEITLLHQPVCDLKRVEQLSALLLVVCVWAAILACLFLGLSFALLL